MNFMIYNIKKTIFEEFEVSIPNKIEKVLQSYDFNLEYIVFTKKNTKNQKNLIEEAEINPTINTFIKENINKFISIIKLFIVKNNIVYILCILLKIKIYILFLYHFLFLYLLT